MSCLLGAGTALWGKGTESMKKLLRTAAAAACLCLLAACAPARQAGGGEPGAPREDFTSVPSGMQAGGEPEAMAAPVAYRAMWVSYLEWPMFDTSGAQGFAASVGSLLDNCAALGLNTVIVQVRPFGDAVYPSAVYPWSHLVTGVQGQDPGYDPLAIFVEQAHARGLAIEAWVNPYRVRLNDTMPPGELAADNPALLHEGWALEANGGLYYDPALPEVQDMVVQGVTEIVQNYDVDGIQFDDYFYPTTDEAFDTESYARYGGGQDLAEWRRANVNTLVQKVYAAVKAVKPEAVFGISPQGNNDNNYSQQYSDVALWLSTPGYVDYIMPQVYWGYNYTLQNGSARFAFENIVDEWLAMPRDDSVSLAFGLGAYRIGAGDGSATESGEWASGHNLADMARTLSVRALYPNDGQHLFPGRFASIRIQISDIPEAIAVPTEAVVPEMGVDKVFLYKGGTARPVEIKTGIRTDSVIQVVRGLSPGDTLITSGTLQLRTGLEVKLDNLR